MGSSFWLFVGVIVVTSILVRGIVEIVKVSKSGGGKYGQRVGDMENQFQDLEADLADARSRIEVLEKIVTDQRYGLSREIDDLANTGSKP